MIVPPFVLWLVLFLVCAAGYAIGRNRGFDRGRLAGLAGRKKYLDTRIEGACKRVTALSIGDYEEHAGSTVASHCYGSPEWFAHLQAKLSGEAGEFAEHYGKAIRDDDWSPFRDGVKKLTPERRLYLLKELGDILWYVVMLAKELGSNLMEVMVLNIEKRNGRTKRGTHRGAGDDR